MQTTRSRYWTAAIGRKRQYATAGGEGPVNPPKLPYTGPKFQRCGLALSANSGPSSKLINVANVPVSSRQLPALKIQQLFRRYSLIWMTMQLLQQQNYCRTAELRRQRACLSERIKPIIILNQCSCFGSGMATFAQSLELMWDKAVKEQNPVFTIQLSR